MKSTKIVLSMLLMVTLYTKENFCSDTDQNPESFLLSLNSTATFHDGLQSPRADQEPVLSARPFGPADSKPESQKSSPHQRSFSQTEVDSLLKLAAKTPRTPGNSPTDSSESPYEFDIAYFLNAIRDYFEVSNLPENKETLET